MTIEHYIVFIGASAPLATELAAMKKRIANAHIVAPAVKKYEVGATRAAISLALINLFEQLGREGVHSEPARLSLWMYEPTSAEQFKDVWSAFGHSAWVETVPKDFLHKMKSTRLFIQERINVIRPLLHEVSNSAYANRNSSPLSLPLRNFDSPITADLKKYWYNDLSKSELSQKIKALKMRLLQTRVKDRGGFKDDKTLIFKPAEELHGTPHPTGAEHKSFACGRFRYGVALFPGFHYDVSAQKTSTIQCELKNSCGEPRLVKGEKRRYINIFPNDHLLPEK